MDFQRGKTQPNCGENCTKLGNMKKALEYIISQIVDNPEKVEVTEQENQGMINFAISVDPSDMGRIIGKNGKVIRSIRNVIKISAIKQNKKINIALNEILPESSQ